MVSHGQNRRPAADGANRRLVLGEWKTKVLWKRAMPVVELVRKIGKLLQRQVIGCFGRVDFFKNLGENAGRSEQGQSAGKLGRLARQSRLEATLGDIFIVGINRVLAVDIVILDVLRQSKYNRRETESKISILILRAKIIENLPVNSVQGPENLLTGFASQCTQSKAFL